MPLPLAACEFVELASDQDMVRWVASLPSRAYDQIGGLLTNVNDGTRVRALRDVREAMEDAAAARLQEIAKYPIGHQQVHGPL